MCPNRTQIKKLTNVSDSDTFLEVITMAKFKLNEILNDVSVTDREKKNANPWDIRNVQIDRIVPSSKNLYGIRDIETLADSIRNVGLLHNLVVREADAEGYFEIISGERRYRACKLLHEEGDTRFSSLPVKVENRESNEVSELKLIIANSAVRELNDYEKVQQAARIKDLLKVLKDQGYPFSGRMRDTVAELMNESATNVARYDVISANLPEEDMRAFKDGDIGVSQAYELAKKPKISHVQDVPSVPSLSFDELSSKSKEKVKLFIGSRFSYYEKTLENLNEKIDNFMKSHTGGSFDGGFYEFHPGEFIIKLNSVGDVRFTKAALRNMLIELYELKEDPNGSGSEQPSMKSPPDDLDTPVKIFNYEILETHELYDLALEAGKFAEDKIRDALIAIITENVSDSDTI